MPARPAAHERVVKAPVTTRRVHEWATPFLPVPQRALDVVGLAEDVAKDYRRLHRHARSPSEVGSHRVTGVADKGDPPPRPGPAEHFPYAPNVNLLVLDPAENVIKVGEGGSPALPVKRDGASPLVIDTAVEEHIEQAGAARPDTDPPRTRPVPGKRAFGIAGGKWYQGPLDR